MVQETGSGENLTNGKGQAGEVTAVQSDLLK
jgi:hypothetical protein